MVSGVAPSVIRRAHGLSALPYVVNLPPSLGNRQEEALQNKYILNPKRLGSRGTVTTSSIVLSSRRGATLISKRTRETSE